MFELALERIAKSSDLLVLMCAIIFVLGMVIRVLWKKINENDETHRKAMVAKDKEISKLNATNLETVTDNTAAMIELKNVTDEIRNDIKDVKNGN